MADHITGFEPFDSQSAIGQLVSSFPDPLKRGDGRGWLPLHWAAVLHDTSEDDLEFITREKPAACIQGHMSSVGVIRTQDTPLNVPYKGLFPLHLICSLQHPLYTNFNKILSTNDVALQCPDHRGWLPLHWCATNCREDRVLKRVIQEFPDANFIPNKKGKLPFQCAAYNLHPEAVDYLYKENPDAVVALDYNGNNPLHDAAKTFNYEVIHKLFAWKADLARIRNFREQLPIHKAFSYIPTGNKRLYFRHLKSIEALIAQNPETLSLPDQDGLLPLHLAVYNNSSYEVVKSIHEIYPSGALVKDGYGKIPINYVKQADVKRLLLKSSAPLVKAGLTDSFSRFAGT